MSRSRTVGRWSFPTTPDASWAPETRARWETARELADAMTAASGAVDRYGWHVESAGRIPGIRRCLGLWALSPVAAVGVVHLLTPMVGLTWACYTAAAVGAAGVVQGARITLRADTANHPPQPSPAGDAYDDAEDAESEWAVPARPPLTSPAPLLVAAEIAPTRHPLTIGKDR